MPPRKLPVLPSMAQAHFEPPFSSGDRKVCLNCAMFVHSSPPHYCVLHGQGVPVTWDSLCTRHVPGAPMHAATARQIFVTFITPILSGLRHVLGGASCDRCAHYTELQPGAAGNGQCGMLKLNPVVAARAYCALWDPKTPPTGLGGA